MAIMKLGIVTTDVRGSVAGTVFSRNLGGAYMRGRVTPVNRNTPAQTLVRQNFAANAKLWSGAMDAAQRSAWTFFAQANPLVNVLGAQIIVSGLAMAQKLNQRLVQIGEAAILDAPADMSVQVDAAPTGVTVVGGGAITMVTGAQTGGFPSKYYIFATKPLAAGKTPTTSDFRFVAAVAAFGAATSRVITTPYLTTFGPVLAGQSVGFAISQISTDSGAVVPAQRFNVIAT